MKTAIRPEIARRFQRIPITQKALREVQALVDLATRGAALAIAAERARLEATVPEQTRVAAYNAGYTRALFDLLEAEDRGGFTAFSIDGRRVLPDENGRLRLEPRP